MPRKARVTQDLFTSPADQLPPPLTIQDFHQFAPKFLQIKTKQRAVIPFVLNGEQEILYAASHAQEQEGLPVRIAVLKPRQIGISTMCQGMVFHRIVTNENTNALAIAHDTKSTQLIFEMSKLFYDGMPFRPMRRYSTRQEIVFENPSEVGRIEIPGLRSRLTIGTAGKMGTGRAATTHVLHCSEIAQWPFPEELVGGLFPSVPYEPGTLILMESTAHGAGDFWHEFLQECHNGENQFAPVFIPWFHVREYQLDLTLTDRWMSKRPPDSEEKRLVKQYGLTDQRLAWRRMRINEFKGDEDLFRQEYPCDDVEAWIVSGRPVFDTNRLLLALDRTRKPLSQGYLDGGLKWHDDRKGPIKVWSWPVEGTRYVIGTDVALGVRGGDYSVNCVLDENDDQVCEWHGHLDPISFAGEVEKVARFYNEGLVAIEIENQGFATQAELRKTYYNMYRWRYMDRFSDKLTDKIGWETNVKTKPMLIAHMAHLVREGDIGLHSKDLVQEMMRFIEPGHAASGCHDDRVMALMIAAYVRSVEYPKGRLGAQGVILPPWEQEMPEYLTPDDLRSHDVRQPPPAPWEREEDRDWREM